MIGGKREGAGRPPEKDPATKLVTIKMTPKQHAKFLEIGGSRWVKRLLDENAKPLPHKPRLPVESPVNFGILCGNNRPESQVQLETY